MKRPPLGHSARLLPIQDYEPPYNWSDPVDRVGRWLIRRHTRQHSRAIIVERPKV